jgi:hypothetical protein
MDQKTKAGWKAAVEDMRRGIGFPSFDVVCRNTGLTKTQAALLSSFGAMVQLVIRARYFQLRLPDKNGVSCLRSMADLIELIQLPQVTGNKRRFVKKMFGKHALPTIKELKNGFRIRAGSEELWNSLYELQVVGEFIRGGYAVELEPLLSSGKRPEFKVRNGMELCVECKSIDADRQLDIIFGDSIPNLNAEIGDHETAITEDDRSALEQLIFRNLEDASQKFRGISMPYAIFVRSPWSPALQDGATKNAVEEFLVNDRPGLIGIAIDTRSDRIFWRVTADGATVSDCKIGDIGALLSDYP